MHHLRAPDFLVDDFAGIGCQDVVLHKRLEELRVVADLQGDLAQNNIRTCKRTSPSCNCWLHIADTDIGRRCTVASRSHRPVGTIERLVGGHAPHEGIHRLQHLAVEDGHRLMDAPAHRMCTCSAEQQLHLKWTWDVHCSQHLHSTVGSRMQQQQQVTSCPRQSSPGGSTSAGRALRR